MIYDKRNKAKLGELHPHVADLAAKAIADLNARGRFVLITQAYRSPSDQRALYLQPWDGKDNDGDGRIDESDEKVTQADAGQSYHNYGLAFDICPCDEDGDLMWGASFGVYARPFQAMGFEWGGDWAGFKDRPHLQYTFGLSIKDLQNGKKPPEPASFASDWWMFDPRAWMRRLARLAGRGVTSCRPGTPPGRDA